MIDAFPPDSPERTALQLVAEQLVDVYQATESEFARTVIFEAIEALEQTAGWFSSKKVRAVLDFRSRTG